MVAYWHNHPPQSKAERDKNKVPSRQWGRRQWGRTLLSCMRLARWRETHEPSPFVPSCVLLGGARRMNRPLLSCIFRHNLLPRRTDVDIRQDLALSGNYLILIFILTTTGLLFALPFCSGMGLLPASNPSNVPSGQSSTFTV